MSAIAATGSSSIFNAVAQLLTNGRSSAARNQTELRVQRSSVLDYTRHTPRSREAASMAKRASHRIDAAGSSFDPK